jgi:major membrane immunogen (membrane-anchored lipoprotein)
MKIRTVLTLVLFVLLTQTKAQDDPRNAHLNYLNYAGFDMKISTVKEVSEIETKDGKVKPSNRNFKLVEVCLKGQNTSGAGLFIYKTAIFLLCINTVVFIVWLLQRQ